MDTLEPGGYRGGGRGVGLVGRFGDRVVEDVGFDWHAHVAFAVGAGSYPVAGFGGKGFVGDAFVRWGFDCVAGFGAWGALAWGGGDFSWVGGFGRGVGGQVYWGEK